MALTIAEVEHVAHLARLRLSAEELEKMRTDLSAILDHIDMLKEVDVSDVAPTAQVTDLFNVMLVYQNYEREQSAESGKQFTYYEHGNNTSKYPLTLLVSGNNGQWDCILEYSGACFTPQDANRLAEQFCTLVSATARRFDDQVLEIVHTNARYPVAENDISFNL